MINKILGRFRPPPIHTLTRKKLLALLAGNSILWRIGAEIAPWLSRLAESIAGSVALTVVSIIGDGVGIFAILCEWILFVVLFHMLFPTFIPAQVREMLPDYQSLKYFFLGTILLEGILLIPDPLLILYLRGELPEETPIWTAQSLLANQQIQIMAALVVVSTIGFSYLFYTRNWRRMDVKDRRRLQLALVAHGTSEEYVKFRQKVPEGHWFKRTFDIIRISAFGLSWVVISLAVIALFYMISAIFPVAELLVLASLAISTVSVYLPGIPLRYLSKRPFDFESQFYFFLKYAIYSVKGRGTLILVILGFFNSALLSISALVGIVFVVLKIPVIVTQTSGLQLLLVSWNLLGGAIIISIPGLYGLWFWHRETARLPHFFTEWDNKNLANPHVVTSDELPPFVTRPPGNLVLPSLVFGIFVGFVYLHYAGYTVPRAQWVFAVLWPLLVLPIGWAIRWTLSHAPQPAESESWILPLSFGIQTTSMIIIVGFDGGIKWFIESLFFIISVCFVAFYSPNVQAYASSHQGVRQYTGSIFFAGTGIVFAGIGLVFNSVVFGSLAVLFLLFAISLLYTTYFDRKFGLS